MADHGAPPSRDDIATLLRSIIDGSTPPYDGARKLWTEFYSDQPDRFPELATFVNDATDYEELPDRRQEIADHIVVASRQLLEAWRK